MTEYASPYKVEAFENPTMANVFKDLLMVKKTNVKRHNVHKSSYTTDGITNDKCPPSGKLPSSPGQTPLTLQDDEDSTSSSFLKSLILEQKNTVNSLMNTAKKIGPVANNIFQKKIAYDAAFESDVPATLPNISGTLQGFTLFLFFTSYIALTIVGSILINFITGSPTAAASAFVGSIIFGILGFTIIIRYA